MAKPTGQFGKYAEEIVREYNKVGTGDERKDWAARDKINKILRMLSSFKLKAWVMGDGTVAISDTKPNGAKQDVNDLIAPLYNAEAKVCNSTNPVVVKAMNACAKNAASVFEYGVGDVVELSSGRKGKVLAKYEKDGDLKIDVDIAGTRMTFGTKDIARVVGNACGTTKKAVAANADDDRTRFRREVEKIYKAAGEAMAMSEDLFYAAAHGEYEDYDLAKFSAKTLNDLAGKLYSFALKARS